MTICQFCKEKLVFDVAIKSQDGRLVALVPGTKTAHDCQGKYKNGNGNAKPKQEESRITNFTLYPQLMEIHSQALEICKAAYGGIYDNNTEDKKLMMVLHWENLITELRCKKEVIPT